MVILQILVTAGDILLVQMALQQLEFAQVVFTGMMKDCFVLTNLKQNVAQLSGKFTCHIFIRALSVKKYIVFIGKDRFDL